MFVYYFVWIMLFLPYFTRKRYKLHRQYEDSYRIYIFLLLTLLIGLRHVSVGADTEQYRYMYRASKRILETTNYEHGYYHVTNILNSLGVDYQIFLLVVAAFASACLIQFNREYCRNLGFSIFVFMTIGLLPMYMSGTRQVLAISICLLAVVVFDKGKNILGTVLILLATTFHVSAIVFLVMVPITKIQLTKKSAAMLIVLSAASMAYKNLLLVIVTLLMPEKYQVKIDIYGGYEINPLLLIIAVLIPMFCVIFDKETENGKFSAKQSTLYCMSCINIVLMMLSVNSMYFSRLAFYFDNANPVLISNVIISQRRQANRIIMIYIIGIICALYFIISIPDGTLQIDKYKFFWQ